MHWDPQQYGRFESQRSRPFLDLIARIRADAPRHVVDLGCGPGTLTALLASRWPSAEVEGIDSAPEMIASAASVPGPVFSLGDVADWTPTADVDVIVSNATLQWVPGHLELVASWATSLPPGGWLAFQVPGNFRSPSHTLMRELAAEPRWAVDGVLRHDGSVEAPSSYASVLLDVGLEVDVWETTYLHVLSGADPIVEWMRGTGLRPVLAALSPDQGAAFSSELAAALRVAYPPTAHGTILPFRHIFAVGHRRA